MWPSSKVAAVTGSSRLTLDPRLRAPRLVRLSVSGTTSIENLGPVFFTTVRQHPFTATLAPILRRRAVAECSTVSRLRPSLATVPTELTIPVNIQVPADQEIVAEACDVEVMKAHRLVQALDTFASERTGGLA